MNSTPNRRGRGAAAFPPAAPAAPATSPAASAAATAPDVDTLIAARVQALRAAAGLSLEALAERSGVSRSMISLIERGQTSPTAVLLERLAAGLGTTLAGLFESPAPQAEPLARAADQPLWRDPGSGYQRRALSPPGTGSPFRLVEVAFPPGARVAYETGARAVPVQQQVWLIEGRLELSVGPRTWALAAGDCLAFSLDQPTAFHNPGPQTARYLVVVSATGEGLW